MSRWGVDRRRGYRWYTVGTGRMRVMDGPTACWWVKAGPISFALSPSLLGGAWQIEACVPPLTGRVLRLWPWRHA